MEDPQEILNTVEDSDEDVIEVGPYTFYGKRIGYEIGYKDVPITQEQLSIQKIRDYQQVAEYYDMWVAGEDLPDIGNWHNLYGEVYWNCKEHGVSYRVIGAGYNSSYDKQIRHPEYFNPSWFKQYHYSENSAVLTLILTVVRCTPKEVGYQHHYQREIISQLQEIHGIGEKTAEKMYDRGVRGYPDITEHIGLLEPAYKSDAVKEAKEKMENNIDLLQETDFLEHYKAEHMANTI